MGVNVAGSFLDINLKIFSIQTTSQHEIIHQPTYATIQSIARCTYPTGPRTSLLLLGMSSSTTHGANVTNVTAGGFVGIIDAAAGLGQNQSGIATKAFVLNIAVGLGLFVFELSGFLLLKSSAIGRRI